VLELEVTEDPVVTAVDVNVVFDGVDVADSSLVKFS
jgi:hypothetical protein